MSQDSSSNILNFESTEDLDKKSSSGNITSMPNYSQKDQVIHFFKNSKTTSNEISNSMSDDKARYSQICPRCAPNPQFMTRSSDKLDINIFGASVKLDNEIISQLSSILSNKSLKKPNEADYFDQMNIFDQEWEFPFNKRHFEYEQLISTIEDNPMEMKVDMYKRTLIDLQIQLRDISDYFIKIDRERLFFRNKLISVLQIKLQEMKSISPVLKKMLKSFSLPKSGSLDEVNKLKKENKESQSLFVNLKRRNVKLEEEVKQLKKKLKEKRTQLKKYMFRKETNEDNSITRASNSGTNQISGDQSREGLSKLKSKTPGLDVMKKKLKFSSTILSNRQKKQTSKDSFPHKNKSTIQKNVARPSLISGNKNDEYCQNNDIKEFLQDSANNFQKAFNNFSRGSKIAERPSILTESGQVEIPEMLLNLQSKRKSRLSGVQGQEKRRPSGFKLNNFVSKKPNNKLSNKLLQIKKRNSKLVNQQNAKNPFLVNKVN